MKNKASKRKKKESTPKRRSQGSKYPNPSAGKNSNRRSNYPPSDAGDTVGYEEEYYDVSNIDESMAYIGFKALAATKIVLLLYSLISCFHLQVTGTGLSSLLVSSEFKKSWKRWKLFQFCLQFLTSIFTLTINIVNNSLCA